VTVFQFTVFGEPQQKGSMRAFVPKGWNRPVVTTTNRNLKAWEALVRSRANQSRAEHSPLGGPIALSINFYFQRPKRLLTKNTIAVFQPHITAPDLSKLVRGLEDALSGILFLDDKQVAKIEATKAYAASGEGSYCQVQVREHYPAQLQFGEVRHEAVQPSTAPLFQEPELQNAKAVKPAKRKASKTAIRREVGF